MSEIITARDIVKNYGTFYKTTGGGILDNLSIKKFTKELVSNRVLDFYLKYMGITTLTPTTLVPIALILGNQYFEDAVNYIKKSDQLGGSFLENKIPVIDDELVGNYLKLSGLSLLNISPYTLIPLGILMTIYEMFKNENNLEEISIEMEGGDVTPLPSDYFNPTKSEQKGSGRNLLGETIPPNILQNTTEFLSGRPVPSFKRVSTYNNNNIQLRDDSIYSSYNSVDFTQPISVNPQTLKNNVGQAGGSDWLSSHMSRGAYNSPGQNETQFKMFSKTGDYVSNNLLSNGASDHWNKSIDTVHIPLYEQNIGNSSNGVPTSQYGGTDDLY